MNILVCVKHVPREEDMKLDPVTKTLIRGGEGEISAMDKFALEIAARIKEQKGAAVTVISMGIPAANATLRYALSVGGDEAYLLSDRALAGSDAYATAVALSAAVRKLEGEKGQPFDLILCGKQASDSDTSLVTPALAELLDRPHTTAVVDFEMTEGAIVATREMDKGTETLRLATPAVLSVSKTVFPARYPNLKLKIQANRKQIPVLDGAALALNPADVGTSGSLTDVGSSFIPERDKSGVKIDGANGAQAAETLMGMLLDRHVI